MSIESVEEQQRRLDQLAISSVSGPHLSAHTHTPPVGAVSEGVVRRCQLMSRHWRILDGDGHLMDEVAGMCVCVCVVLIHSETHTHANTRTPACVCVYVCECCAQYTHAHTRRQQVENQVLQDQKGRVCVCVYVCVCVCLTGEGVIGKFPILDVRCDHDFSYQSCTQQRARRGHMEGMFRCAQHTLLARMYGQQYVPRV